MKLSLTSAFTFVLPLYDTINFYDACYFFENGFDVHLLSFLFVFSGIEATTQIEVTAAATNHVTLTSEYFKR